MDKVKLCASTFLCHAIKATNAHRNSAMLQQALAILCLLCVTMESYAQPTAVTPRVACVSISPYHVLPTRRVSRILAVREAGFAYRALKAATMVLSVPLTHVT